MKNLKYIYLLGILIAFLGFVMGIISQTWLPIPIILLVLGLMLMVIGIGLYFPKTLVTTNTMIITLSFLLILGLLNFLVVRNEVRIDLTENQVFTLSSQSQAIVSKLTQPLKVWLFQSQLNSGDLELLKNYSRYSSQFSFKLVDPEIEIQLAKEFEIKSIGEVHIQYGPKKRLIQKISEVESLSEAKLTSGIQAIQSDRPPATLYFLQGHGETELTPTEEGLSQAVESLTDRGYQVKPLNLAQVNKIPEDTQVIVVISPKRQLSKGEVEALSKYLTENGRLLLMLDPKTDPGLTPLLEEWGIKLDQRIVIDVSGTGGLIGFGPATVIITNYGDHPITEAFGDGISVYHLSRLISTTPKPEIEAVALLITNQQAWAEGRLDGEQIEFDPTEDIPGPLDIGVALNHQNNKDKNSRLVVIGNATFATNGWFTQQMNKDMFLNTIEWLGGTQTDPILSISPKEPNNRRINLTVMQANILGWLALVLVPLFGFAIALVTWWRGR